MTPLLEGRFWAKVQKTGGCWLWIACKDKDGYGIFQVDGRARKAHRVSWELHNGPIPEGLDVLHECDTPPCVKPGHFFLGTNADNMADKVAKGRQARTQGPANGCAKLTADQVRDIRSRQGQTQRSLSEEFGVSRPHISAIRSGKFWAHISQE